MALWMDEHGNWTDDGRQEASAMQEERAARDADVMSADRLLGRVNVDPEGNVTPVMDQPALKMQALCAALRWAGGDHWQLEEVVPQHVKDIARALYREATGEEWAGRADGWRPIETAPKDGTPLLLFARAKTATASVVVVGHYMPDEGWVEVCFGGEGNHPVGIVPSHWMPRPVFPDQPIR